MSDLVLGIETSCDETAAAVIAEGRRVLSNVVASQAEIHAKYGGVFPEIASRQHVVKIVPVIREALEQANTRLEDLGGIAVTYGPGLAGSLVVGVNTAKGLAMASGRPLIGINHLESHIYVIWALEDHPPIQFPILTLIASGGHTFLVLMTDHGRYRLLGETLDDAAGEAFDKVARLLGLGYPGGPEIQRVAERGDPGRYPLPRAWLEGTYDFSFSGLKTAVLRLLQKDGGEVRQPDPQEVADIGASFQESAVDVLAQKTRRAAEEFGAKLVILGGGVAANQRLRQEATRRIRVPVVYPPPRLCTDNAVGISIAGWFRLQRGERSGWDLDVVPRARLA